MKKLLVLFSIITLFSTFLFSQTPIFINEIHYDNESVDVDEGRKKVHLPQVMDSTLSCFLGYFVTEGFSYYGSSAEIGLSNTDEKIIKKMIHTIEFCFNTSPIDYTKQNRTIRLISKTVFNYLELNFPEIINKSYDKRIPYQIFGSDVECRKSFLMAAFEGDGGVESTAIAYYTSSKGLAYDYQDLLLTFNIHSRIMSELYHFGKDKSESRLRYKIYIRGDSLQHFINVIFPELSSHEIVKNLLYKSSKTNRRHDVLPPYIANIIKTSLKDLGLTYDGYFHQHIKNNYGINQEIIDMYIKKLTDRIIELKKSLNTPKNLSEFRKLTNYSQAQLAQVLEISRGNVDCAENGGYSEEKRLELLSISKTRTLEIIKAISLQLIDIKTFQNFRWLKIKSVQEIPNEGEYATDWVYDVTIEPTENFISHGLVLHNTVSIAKAGIVATLQSKTAIIAAANPKSGRWDDYLKPFENINLSPPIRSRFDLIYKVRDLPEKIKDDMIAEHILKNHMEGFQGMFEEDNPSAGAVKKQSDVIPTELLSKYIRYMKRNSHPRLDLAAAKKIKEFYVDIRNSNPDPNTVSIVARNLESIVRMSEAYAKMANKKVVDVSDVENVLELEKRHLRDIGYDEETETYDVDMLQTGTSSSKRAKLRKILDQIKELQHDDDTPLEFEDIVVPLMAEGLKEDMIKEALDKWSRDGTLYSPKPGTYSLIKKRNPQ